jgi:type IV pilus assembly protein PilC
MATTSTKKPTKPAVKADDGLKNFAWKGKDKRGIDMAGEMLSKNPTVVKVELRKLGIDPRSITPVRQSLNKGKAVTAKDIAVFSRQMATMMKSGVPLVQAFGIISGGQKNPRFKKVLDDIADSISGGSTLSEALGKYPLLFDELYQNLVRAGEGAGVLEEVLDTIASYKENTESLKGKIKKALFYPAVVVAVAILVSAVLLIFVVPQFQNVFKSFGAELPGFTQMIIAASDFMIGYWWLILFITIGLGWGFINLKKRSKQFARLLDRIILYVPVIGGIMHNSAIARFARTLGTTFKAGVPLVEALETVSGATGNIVYADAVKRIMSDVEVGYALNVSMRQTKVFPHMVIQMTAIGEEAGALDTMLFKIAEFYEEEVNNTVDALSSLIEPFIMLIIGGLVGSMVVGMYLPIFKLAATM